MPVRIAAIATMTSGSASEPNHLPLCLRGLGQSRSAGGFWSPGAPATNKLQFLIRELVPLGLDLSFGLFPHSLNGIPIHRIPRLRRC